MTKIARAKYKISRRLGVSLWGRAKDAFNKRNYAPGQHGASVQRKKTTYGVQHNAKQKLQCYYNMTEKQFKIAFIKARQQKGNTAENLVRLLERRLDATVYRLNLAPTIFSARQLVSHKHVLVNGKSVNIASYAIKEGDVVELTASAKQIPLCMESVQKMERPVPSYLSFDSSSFKGSLVSMPQISDVPYPAIMEFNLIIEFYSK